MDKGFFALYVDLKVNGLYNLHTKLLTPSLSHFSENKNTPRGQSKVSVCQTATEKKPLTDSGYILTHVWVWLGFWSAVLPKSLLFRDVGEKVDERRHQDICGVHDLVAHNDFGKRHTV